MFAKLKKLVGADAESRARRQQALEQARAQERCEREERIAQNQAAIKRGLEAEGQTDRS